MLFNTKNPKIVLGGLQGFTFIITVTLLLVAFHYAETPWYIIALLSFLTVSSTLAIIIEIIEQVLAILRPD